MCDFSRLKRRSVGNAAALFTVVVILLGARVVRADSKDHCYDVLSQNLLNNYSKLNQSNLSQALRNSACNEVNSGKSGGSGGGVNIGVPIDDVPVKFGGSFDSQYSNYL